VQRVERAELLGDHQRLVVGEHDAAGADPDPGRRSREVRDQNRGRRARDAGHAVVLGHPVAGVAELVDAPGERGARGQRCGGRRAGTDRDEVEHGERHHARCNDGSATLLPLLLSAVVLSHTACDCAPFGVIIATPWASIRAPKRVEE